MNQKLYRGSRLFSPTRRNGTLDSELHHASGTRVIVVENDEERDLDLRLDVRDHSPTGFNWGYGGSGPAQLALAICCDCLGDETGGDPYVYQTFKDAFVSAWDAEWEVSEKEIRQWAESLVEAT